MLKNFSQGVRNRVFFALGATAVGCLFFLLPLDLKVFDLFHRVLPPLEEYSKVQLLTIDDFALAQAGVFPWPRDVLAKSLELLGELESGPVVFDLSFLDPGLKSVNEEAFEAFKQSLQNEMKELELEPSISAVRLSELRSQLSLNFDRIVMDPDVQFAGSLKFHGNAYINFTFLGVGEEARESPDNNDIQKWMDSTLAFQKNTLSHVEFVPTAQEISPALELFMKSAKGGGFVNASPDFDGYRRRVHLVMQRGNSVFPNLALAALLPTLGSPGIQVFRDRIVLQGGSPEFKNKIIPRTEDGSILMNWPKKRFEEYNRVSMGELFVLENLEQTIVKNLHIMEDSGFYSSLKPEENPLVIWKNAADYRRGAENQNPPSLDQFRVLRREFRESVRALVQGSLERELMSLVGDGEMSDYVNEMFTLVRSQLQALEDLRTKLSTRIMNSIIIIGVDATGMTDVGLTTYQERFPNVGLYAALTNMILSDDYLDEAPLWTSCVLALMSSLLLALLTWRMSPKALLISGISLLLGLLGMTLGIFLITRVFLGPVVPLISTGLTFLSLAAVDFLGTVREKIFLESAFSRYLSPDVIKEIQADPSKLSLGGEKRVMTALFTDIQGFSTISESMDPTDLVKLLNRYLTRMSDIILAKRGTIDKYEGDAIIAFFGAPLQVPDHAILACKTAIAMKKAEAQLNSQFLAEGLSPVPLFTRIGINTGDMVVGNMGTASKMDYTIMGNAVNLAARLEGVNKQYQTRGILISAHTKDFLGEEFVVRRLDMVRVVGVHTPLRLYELIDLRESADEALLRMIDKWEEAFGLYEAQKWRAAADLFRELVNLNPSDGCAKIYHERSTAYSKNPPPSYWDGVVNLTSK